MYKTFINYKEEFNFYSNLLLKDQCRSVVELGCGTANLAGDFVKHGFTYTGIDLSQEMLGIARRNNPTGRFLQGDMRNFVLPEKSESCIITGRSTSYLITNKDVHDTLSNINNNLHSSGIICFDCIDANKFIPQIRKGESVVHKAAAGAKKFHRESFWDINLSESWAFDWLSVYYEEAHDGGLTKIGEDQSTIRAFCKDDMNLFLELTGFELKEIIDRPSYAFDTFVVVAKKVKGK